MMRFVQFSDAHLDGRLEESEVALPKEKRQKGQTEELANGRKTCTSSRAILFRRFVFGGKMMWELRGLPTAGGSSRNGES
jgi:hypothetical protein